MQPAAVILSALLLVTTALAQAAAPVKSPPVKPAAARNAAPAAASPGEAAARTMADGIVTAFDRGQIAAQWSLAGPALRAMASETVFVDTITGLRRQAGPQRTRRLLGIDISDDLPDSPPGVYATIFYTTDFAGFSNIEEKVVLEAVDGRWRLAGYYLKQLPAPGAD